jgi:hypothetical protein
MTIIDELPNGPHQNLKITGLTHENYTKFLDFIEPTLMCSVRKLKLVNCSLRRYSSYKKIIEKFLFVTHVTFECCTTDVVFDESLSQIIGDEDHENDFTFVMEEFDNRKFKDDENFVAMALFVTHLEVIYSDSYIACLFSISPLKSLRHGGFGDPRVIFMMLLSCPDLKELHVFEYSKNFVNFMRKFDDEKDCPSLKNRLEVFTVDHMYDHYLSLTPAQMTWRQLKRMEPLAMISFLQTQRESLKELTIMNCPSNGDLVLMSSLLNIEKLEMGIENFQEIEGALNFQRALEKSLKQMRLHGRVKKMETMKAFVSQFRGKKIYFHKSKIIHKFNFQSSQMLRLLTAILST